MSKEIATLSQENNISIIRLDDGKANAFSYEMLTKFNELLAEVPRDSGSLVIDTITAGGKTDGPMPQRIFWCVFEGLVAIALLLGGGLAALQAMAVTTGFPFAAVLLLLCVSIWKGLRSELSK